LMQVLVRETDGVMMMEVYRMLALPLKNKEQGLLEVREWPHEGPGIRSGDSSGFCRISPLSKYLSSWIAHSLDTTRCSLCLVGVFRC